MNMAAPKMTQLTLSSGAHEAPASKTAGHFQVGENTSLGALKTSRFRQKLHVLRNFLHDNARLESDPTEPPAIFFKNPCNNKVTAVKLNPQSKEMGSGGAAMDEAIQ